MKLSADEGDLLTDPQMYRKMVGKLVYLTITRPDLSYAIGLVSQFVQNPRKPHLHAARRILRYVKFTIQYGLYYTIFGSIQLHGYTDADWVGSIQDRRSTSGYAFSIGSAVVSWASKKQPTVALSSTEAEYQGATLAARDAVWLKALLEEIGIKSQDPIPIYADNISSIMLANNPVFHARTKHIEVHYHFIREKVLSREIDLEYVAIEDQVANILTKALSRTKFERFRSSLGVLDIEWSLRGSVNTPSSSLA